MNGDLHILAEDATPDFEYSGNHDPNAYCRYARGSHTVSQVVISIAWIGSKLKKQMLNWFRRHTQPVFPFFCIFKTSLAA